ncbi:hypothetical protein Glove_203g93 [Diversispora epigaea]|uniref:Uncharacterized protein n=1 Tax=Diversispora epigaea TaxID=1348612 RepID=A0A397IJK2_9GLOM|nr:hypothetical protein Glove_203g93 [Diversispora epigaea]
MNSYMDWITRSSDQQNLYKENFPEEDIKNFKSNQNKANRKKTISTAMKYSTVTRIIIIILFIVAHVTQAYKIAVKHRFASVCKIYVTDCNGKVLRDDGREDCSRSGTIFDVWDQAPDLYCVHIYPITEPKNNKYVTVTKDDACVFVHGDLFSWSMDLVSSDNCWG